MKPNNRRAWLFALAMMLIAANILAQKSAPARIVVKSHLYDFGTVIYGTKVLYTFTIENKGSDPLTISSVTAPCECFHATFDNVIPPSQHGRVNVEIDTTALDGGIFMTATVNTNRKDQKATQLEIRGFVKSAVNLLPKNSLALTTIQGEDKVEDLFLEVYRPEPLQVVGVESSDKRFAVRQETITAGKKYRFIVKASGAAPIGYHRGKITIKTNDPKLPTLTADVGVLVLSSVVAEPSTLFLPRITPDQVKSGVGKRSWKITLKNSRGRSFDVLEIKPEADFLKTTLSSTPDRKSHEIVVSIKPNTLLKEGMTPIKLHVRTNLPDGEDIVVPVVVTVARPS
jgi:hypothetical protein